MTRPQQTDSEQRLAAMLLEHLRVSNPSMEPLEREQMDAPDCAFTSPEGVIACECVQIPPARVFKWLYRRLGAVVDGSSCHAVIWAEEPHSWVRMAIRAKAPKVSQYRQNVSASEVWLLVHTPLEDTQVFVRGDFAWEAQMLRWGACQESHTFDRVLFWEPKSGFQTIYTPGQTADRVRFDFSKGYPSRSFVQFGVGPFDTTAPGEPPRTYSFPLARPKLIVIPPFDPEFRKHKPRFRNRTYEITITAYSDRATSEVKTHWDDEPDTRKDVRRSSKR